MYKIIIWFSLIVALIISSFVFTSGFIPSLAITNSSTNPKVSVATSNSYNILIMGDSLANATGDEKCLGFTNDFVNFERLKTAKEVNVDNIAVTGDKSIDLLKIVEKKVTWQVIDNSEIIFISIGGNDLKKFKSNEVSLTGAKDIENSYLDNLKSTFSLIRSKNKTCTIVFIGLYNPFGKALTPNKLKLLNTWNYDTQQLLSHDTSSVFIPTYDLFKYSLEKYLSVDNFHPNSFGYEAISRRVVETLKKPLNNNKIIIK